MKISPLDTSNEGSVETQKPMKAPSIPPYVAAHTDSVTITEAAKEAAKTANN